MDKKNVLVADDDAILVFGLVNRLKELGFSVEQVYDGKSSLERINRGGMDAAVLDWNMPPRGMKMSEAIERGYSGDIVAKRARELYPKMAIILYSSNADKFRDELQPLTVQCFDKIYGHEPVIAYLEKELK